MFPLAYSQLKKSKIYILGWYTYDNVVNDTKHQVVVCCQCRLPYSHIRVDLGQKFGKDLSTIRKPIS